MIYHLPRDRDRALADMKYALDWHNLPKDVWLALVRHRALMFLSGPKLDPNRLPQ